MPTDLPVQRVNPRSGLALTYSPADPAGNTVWNFFNGVLHYMNAGPDSITVTIRANGSGPFPLDGSFEVPAGGERLIGPLVPDYFNSRSRSGVDLALSPPRKWTDYTGITYSSAIGLSVAAISLNLRVTDADVRRIVVPDDTGDAWTLRSHLCAQPLSPFASVTPRFVSASDAVLPIYSPTETRRWDGWAGLVLMIRNTTSYPVPIYETAFIGRWPESPWPRTVAFTAPPSCTYVHGPVSWLHPVEVALTFGLTVVGLSLAALDVFASTRSA